ncbi:MAG: Sir2 family NAD-dependent protein deacetylase [Planctomycetes bacterium GWF2_42_9]|nr:MAG: Sir2 family NAD-dependent protein deacetylase [Planctomycetes bacterium GWF2_42_9]
MKNLLKDAYRRKALILFVGSGISSNLGLPTWKQLISEIAKQLDFDPDVFKTYGSPLALAEYYKLTKTKLGGLRSWMDINWHTAKIEEEMKKSKVHELIANGKFPIIYTTNYDRWIEKAFEHYKVNYTKIAKVSDLLNQNDGITQIIKFHGDFDDDQSIVLDESSYFRRLDFEDPLDIKLRSDILGKSVFFIGYSLSDINIRLLFYKLTKIWESDNGRPSSYFFSNRPNPIQEKIFKNWGIEMISSEEHDDANKGCEELLNFIMQ